MIEMREKKNRTSAERIITQVTAKKLPTILLFKAHSKESPEKFTGEHDVASLEAFIDEKARPVRFHSTLVLLLSIFFFLSA